jgi:hypothetical protein
MPTIRMCEPGGNAPERSRPWVTMAPMGEYEFRHLYLPRGTTRGAATRLLTDHAEYGHWELLRLRLFADGSRRATLRRRVIRVARTA